MPLWTDSAKRAYELTPLSKRPPAGQERGEQKERLEEDERRDREGTAFSLFTKS